VTLRPADRFDSPQAVETLAGELKALPKWTSCRPTRVGARLNAILAALEQVVRVAALLLGLGVVAIAGNTSGSTSTAGARRSRSSSWWAAATRSCAGRSFTAGLVRARRRAARLAAGVHRRRHPGGADRAGRGPVRVHVPAAGLDAQAVLVLVGGGAVLGWIGSWVTATYHLRRIEPTA